MNNVHTPVDDWSSPLLWSLTPSNSTSSFRAPSSRVNHSHFDGAIFSADASCILTSRKDHGQVIVYESKSLYTANGEEMVSSNATLSSALSSSLRSVIKASPALTLDLSERVLDYKAWPHWNFSVPLSCLALTSVVDRPLQLWNVPNGSLQASYLPLDVEHDRMLNALCLCFTHNGQTIGAGFSDEIRLFDVASPGSECDVISTAVFDETFSSSRRRLHVKRQRSGLISCLDACQDGSQSLLAAGAFSGQVSVIDLTSHESCLRLECQKSGVTQVSFSPDSRLLLVGARNHRDILCWDLRHTRQVIGSFQRDLSSNQRVAFALDPTQGRWLITGSENGRILVFDLLSPTDDQGAVPLSVSFVADSDGACVNGVDFHPDFSQQMPWLVVSTGQRVFDDLSSSSDESSANEEEKQNVDTEMNQKGSRQQSFSSDLQLWQIGSSQL